MISFHFPFTVPLICFYSLLSPILLSRCKAIIEEAVKWAPDTMRSHLKEYINNKVQQGDVWAPQGWRLEKGGYLLRIMEGGGRIWENLRILGEKSVHQKVNCIPITKYKMRLWISSSRFVLFVTQLHIVCTVL